MTKVLPALYSAAKWDQPLKDVLLDGAGDAPGAVRLARLGTRILQSIRTKPGVERNIRVAGDGRVAGRVPTNRTVAAFRIRALSHQRQWTGRNPRGDRGRGYDARVTIRVPSATSYGRSVPSGEPSAGWKLSGRPCLGTLGPQGGDCHGEGRARSPGPSPWDGDCVHELVDGWSIDRNGWHVTGPSSGHGRRYTDWATTNDGSTATLGTVRPLHRWGRALRVETVDPWFDMVASKHKSTTPAIPFRDGLTVEQAWLSLLRRRRRPAFLPAVNGSGRLTLSTACTGPVDQSVF